MSYKRWCMSLTHHSEALFWLSCTPSLKTHNHSETNLMKTYGIRQFHLEHEIFKSKANFGSKNVNFYKKININEASAVGTSLSIHHNKSPRTFLKATTFPLATRQIHILHRFFICRQMFLFFITNGFSLVHSVIS